MEESASKQLRKAVELFKFREAKQPVLRLDDLVTKFEEEHPALVQAVRNETGTRAVRSTLRSALMPAFVPEPDQTSFDFDGTGYLQKGIFTTHNAATQVVIEAEIRSCENQIKRLKATRTKERMTVQRAVLKTQKAFLIAKRAQLKEDLKLLKPYAAEKPEITIGEVKAAAAKSAKKAAKAK